MSCSSRDPEPTWQQNTAYVTSGGIRHYPKGNDWDVHDLVALDFTEPCAEWPDLRSMFYNWRESPPDVPNSQVGFLIVSGYPTTSQNYQFGEDQALALTKHAVICRVERQTSDDSVLQLKPLRDLEYDPDGMSGGGAFVVIIDRGSAVVHLAGLTVRAGSKHIYMVKSGHIRNFLDTAMATE